MLTRPAKKSFVFFMTAAAAAAALFVLYLYVVWPFLICPFFHFLLDWLRLLHDCSEPPLSINLAAAAAAAVCLTQSKKSQNEIFGWPRYRDKTSKQGSKEWRVPPPTAISIALHHVYLGLLLFEMTKCYLIRVYARYIGDVLLRFEVVTFFGFLHLRVRTTIGIDLCCSVAVAFISVFPSPFFPGKS